MFAVEINIWLIFKTHNALLQTQFVKRIICWALWSTIKYSHFKISSTVWTWLKSSSLVRGWSHHSRQKESACLKSIKASSVSSAGPANKNNGRAVGGDTTFQSPANPVSLTITWCQSQQSTSEVKGLDCETAEDLFSGENFSVLRRIFSIHAVVFILFCYTFIWKTIYMQVFCDIYIETPRSLSKQRRNDVGFWVKWKSTENSKQGWFTF